MPRRRDYLLLVLLFAAVAVYGSLVPLRFRPLGLFDAIERFKGLFGHLPGRRSLSDWAANLMLFVPIGYCLLGVLAVDRKRIRAILCVPGVLALCATLSVIIEFTQLWIPIRTPSSSDIIAQCIGTAAGILLWLLVGQEVTDYLRSFNIVQRPKVLIDALLRLYVVGLLIYSVLPLDIAISPADLVHKYRAGRISVIPFSDARCDLVTPCRLFRDTALFIPVGMLAATWLTSSKRPVRSLASSVLLGGLVVACIESAQLFVYSRPAAAGDLITGTIGVWAGAWLMARWRRQGHQDEPQPAPDSSPHKVWLRLAMAAAYSLFLVIAFCWPLEPIRDPQQLKARFDGFISVPFASLYRGSPLDAILEVPKKLLLYALLGAMLAWAAMPLRAPRPIRRLFLAMLLAGAAGVALLIEMLQVFLPPHVPDVSDVILCTAGAAIGMLVTLRIAAGRKQLP